MHVRLGWLAEVEAICTTLDPIAVLIRVRENQENNRNTVRVLSTTSTPEYYSTLYDTRYT